MNLSALEQDWDKEVFAEEALSDWSDIPAVTRMGFASRGIGLSDEFQDPYAFGASGRNGFVMDSISLEDDPE
ncbi:MAG TPA: hypothetical protein VHB46_19540 [Burkholderiales bacterium]|nr:hypothetical protein [Burkholderiales bacterium]